MTKKTDFGTLRIEVIDTPRGKRFLYNGQDNELTAKTLTPPFDASWEKIEVQRIGRKRKQHGYLYVHSRAGPCLCLSRRDYLRELNASEFKACDVLLITPGHQGDSKVPHGLFKESYWAKLTILDVDEVLTAYMPKSELI